MSFQLVICVGVMNVSARESVNEPAIPGPVGTLLCSETCRVVSKQGEYL